MSLYCGDGKKHIAKEAIHAVGDTYGGVSRKNFLTDLDSHHNKHKVRQRPQKYITNAEREREAERKMKRKKKRDGLSEKSAYSLQTPTGRARQGTN